MAKKNKDGVNKREEERDMRKAFYILTVIALCLTGCVEQEKIDPQLPDAEPVGRIEAVMDDVADTRVHLSEGNKLVWNGWENIGVFTDRQDMEVYNLESYDDGHAIFTGNQVTGERYYAFYPYYDNVIDREDRYKLHFYLSNSWTNRDENLTLPMVAKSNNTKVQFKQTCGIIKIALYGKGTLNRIRLEGNDDEIISGDMVIDMNAKQPVIKADNNSDYQYSYINYYDNIVLDKETPTYFYFAVPPMTFNKGIILYIYGIDPDTGTSYELTKKSFEPVEVERAMIVSFMAFDASDLLQEEKDQLAKEKDALIALYNATDGEHWNNSNNWNSDKPLNEWFGVDTDSRGHVTGIWMPNNNLVGSIPSKIGDLTELINLNLSENQLKGKMPKNMEKLKELRYLYLNNNLLTDIPKGLWNNGSLSYVDLSYNQIKTIPECTDCPNLDILSMEYNILTSLPTSLWNMKSLTYLDLTHNQLKELPAEVGNLTNLEGLDLDNNLIEGEIPTEISNLKKLRSLDLSNNLLTGKIPSAISKCKALVYLSLSYNMLTGKIPEKMVNLKDLKYFYAYNNMLSDKKSDELVTYLEALDTFSAYSRVTSIDVPVTSVKVSRKEMTIGVGITESIDYEILPNDASFNDVTFTSSNPTVAIVSWGEIQGRSPGSATIKVITKDGQKTASIKVTVVPTGDQTYITEGFGHKEQDW